MAEFNAGDKVLVNGNLVAEIHTYNKEADRLVYVVNQNGGTNHFYGHVSNTRLQHLVHDVEAVPDLDAGSDEAAEDDSDDEGTAGDLVDD